jgi:L-ascorbate metabolism protein UlaG (beta-lactamase superfamily)
MKNTATITFLGHANFKLTLPDEKTIFVDPWLEENPACPQELKTPTRADLVLITHGHSDHFDVKTLETMTKLGAKIIAPTAVRWYLSKHGFENLEPLNTGGTLRLHDVAVTMTHAQHGSFITEEDDGAGHLHEAVGYIVEVMPNYRIYFAGDTGIFGDMRLLGELYHPQLAVLPIGGRYTMAPFEAAHALRLLGSREVLPFHYGTMPGMDGTPEELANHASNIKNLKIHALKPGETLELPISY